MALRVKCEGGSDTQCSIRLHHMEWCRVCKLKHPLPMDSLRLLRFADAWLAVGMAACAVGELAYSKCQFLEEDGGLAVDFARARRAYAFDLAIPADATPKGSE